MSLVKSLMRIAGGGMLAASMFGCALAPPVGPDGKLLTLSDAGPYPSDPDGVIHAWMTSTLKDPYSAVYGRRSQGVAVVVPRSVMDGTKGGAGWMFCFEVNAKNGYGAYAGMQEYWVLINGNRVIDRLEGFNAKQACATAFQ
jgi:hypothetical protein